MFREQVVFGCHVHVGIEDREAAIQTMNRVRPWLPVLLALSGNSPYWLGADTGYASYRTEVWNRWPMAGMPQAFASRAEYDRLVETLMATGSVREPTKLYWDVRPSARQETLEFRVAGRALPAAELVRLFLDRVRPGLEAGGDLEEVTELVQATVARGTGAARQRAVFERTGSLEAVVDLVVEATAR